MLGDFACVRYRLVLEAISPLRLQAFAGSTLRGGFGHVFKRSVCIWAAGQCRRCLLKNTCSHPYIFETAPPPGSQKLRGIDQIPRPFVIEPPEAERRQFAPGDRFDFHLVLVGRAIHYLPYFVFTFTELGQAGLGPGRGRYRLLEVHEQGAGDRRQIYAAADGVLHESTARVTGADLEAGAKHSGATDAQPGRRTAQPAPLSPPARGGPTTTVSPPATGHRTTSSLSPPGRGQGEGERTPEVLPPSPAAGAARLTVRFLSPTRIQSGGRIQTEITFQDLVRALLRRLSSLMYFHCGSELSVDFRGLIDHGLDFRTVASALRWHDQSRFSGRQRQRIDMGGVVGTVTYQAPTAADLAPYRPLLEAGQWVHVGKGCVMGLGKYRWEMEA